MQTCKSKHAPHTTNFTSSSAANSKRRPALDRLPWPLYIKEQTGATAGNLSVQIDKLSSAGYISVEKKFEGKKPKTTCKITQTGVDAFENYVKNIQQYLKP